MQIQAAPSSKPAMTLREIVEFALQVPLAEIDFIREAATMNQALADEGLQGMACVSARSSPSRWSASCSPMI